MEYLKNKIFNKSEIARLIGISPDLFRQKLYKRHFNKFTPEQIQQINKIVKEIFENKILPEMENN